ncbi:MAG TPA: ATP-binding protein [Chloroflexia bacterium]|nr:ATP-binding protein [Chloroflexia bacterium]
MIKLLRRKISLQLLSFYILFVIPVLLGGLGFYYFERNQLQQEAESADLGLVQAIALETETNLGRVSEIANSLATSDEARHLDFPQLQRTFANRASAHPDISLFFVHDPQGNMLTNYPYNPQPIGQNFAYREYFQEALKSDKPYVSDVRDSATLGITVVTVSRRITNEQGQIVGMLGINLSLEKMTANLNVVRQKMAKPGIVRIWVVDGNGKALANTEGVPPQTDLQERLPSLKLALKGESGNLITTEQGREWLNSYVPVQGSHWAVIVQRPTDVAFASINNFQTGLVIALVLLLLGASFFWFMLNRRVITPLSRLAQATSALTPDKPEGSMNSAVLAHERQRIDEIGNLVAAFVTMEANIHAHFEAIYQQLQEQLQILEAIMRSMEEGLLLESPDGKVVYANQRFCESMGLSHQEVVSEGSQALRVRLAELLVSPEAYNQAVLQAQTGGPRIFEFQVRGIYKGVGEYRPIRRDIRLRVFNVRDRNGQLIGRGKIYQDVTSQNEVERVKTNLLAVVSHELRTPLTAIKGYASGLLEQDVEWDEASRAYCLQQIVEEADRLAEMVTSLLEMSQVEAGTLKLSQGQYQLDSLVREAIQQSRTAYDQQRINIDLPAELPLVEVDGRRFRVVLRNLLENARKYGGEKALIEVKAALEPDNNNGQALLITVQDNGPGIPPDLTERIFERFYQVESGLERSSSGVGLGLAICRGLVAAHGGRIWAENRIDGQSGAVFHIWLPARLLQFPQRAANQPKIAVQ